MAALVLAIGLAVRDNRSAALTQLATATPAAVTPATGTTIDAAIPAAAPPEPSQGDSFRLPRGGFTLVAPAGYTLDLSGESALLRAEDGLAAGMVLQLNGGLRARFEEVADEPPDVLFNRLADLYAAENGLAVGSAEPMHLPGAEAISAPLVGDDTAGQFVMMQPAPDQLVTLAASGPQDAWENQGASDVIALLNALTFFSPERPTLGIAAAASTAQAPSPTVTQTPDAAEASPTATLDQTTNGTRVDVPTLGTPVPLTPTPVPALPTRTSGVQIYSNGNFVNNVAVMRSTVWAATGGGVVAWNKSSGGYVKFTVEDGLATNRTVAASVCQLPGLGVLFAGDFGIQVFDTQNGRWRTLDSSSSDMRYDDVSALWCDAEQERLVVSYARHGLDLYDAAGESWRYVGEDEGLAISGVRDLAVAPDQTSIWLATDEGLALYQEGEVTLYTTENSPLVENRIETLAVDGSGAVWLATGDTLYRTDGDEWSAFNAEGAGQANFPTGRITGLDLGSDGAIWIGSDQAQICRFDPGIEGCIEFYSNAEGMATAPVTSLTIGPEGEVYYTTAGGGISAFDGESWRSFVIADEVAPGNTIYDLAQDATGAIWIGALGGVARISPDDAAGAQIFTPATSPLPSANVRVVEAGGSGGMWFGAEGVSVYDGAAWTSYTTDDGLAGSPVQAIAVDSQNRTWIGTPRGVSIWTGSAFFNLTSANGLPSDDIRALLADGDVVWIGTRGGGLLRFQDNQLQVFNRSNIALPSDDVTALALAADGALLIATTQGLARFAENSMTALAPLAGTPIVALAAGPDGTVWVVDEANTLSRAEGTIADDTAWVPVALPLQPGRQINTLLVDRMGDVWLGYGQGGLVRYTP